MQAVQWHDALLAIENESGVILVLTHDHAPSKLLCQRMKSYSDTYSRRGYCVRVVRVDAECAPHPELAAVRLPQIRVFEDGEEVKRLVGVVSENVLDDLV